MSMRSQITRVPWAALFLLLPLPQAAAQVAVRGDVVYTMAGAPIEDGMVVIRDGRIAAVGHADDVNVPDGFRVLEAAVVTPGLVDAHGTVGLSGILNSDHDQEQLERSQPVQPALRAVDAYNAQDELIAWVRSFGITTVHTGHAPGELISGQTMIVKTVGDTVEDAMVVRTVAVACTLSASARKGGSQSPGTRAKMIAMLREKLIAAEEYRQRRTEAEGDATDASPVERDLEMEALVAVLNGDTPLLVTADRAQDIANALRLAEEFGIRLWLDSAAESYLLLDEIRESGFPVLLHPTMARASGERENLSFETASRLAEAGIPFAMQSGYEPYVPKTRVVLFEAGLAAAHGLTFEEALASITRDAAEILGVADRVGSLQIGMDGDLALFDGDPFEYTTHCIGVVIDGRVVSDEAR